MDQCKTIKLSFSEIGILLTIVSIQKDKIVDEFQKSKNPILKKILNSGYKLLKSIHEKLTNELTADEIKNLDKAIKSISNIFNI